MASRIAGHFRAQVIGYIALVVAMSGTAYAVGANSIGDRELAPNSVGSSEVEPQSVTGKDIAAGAVGSKQLAGDPELDCYIGQILHVGFDFAPDGTLPADGRSLSINDYQALYSLYGTIYGGDGTSTFDLPNLNSGQGQPQYVVCYEGLYPPRP